MADEEFQKEIDIIWKGEVVRLTEDQLKSSPEIRILMDQIKKEQKEFGEQTIYVARVDPNLKTITLKVDA